MNKSVILCHGLNNTSRVMLALETLFKSKGYDTFNIKLTGHEDGLKQVNAELWKNDLRQAYASVIKSDKQPIFCGFSLGCMIHHALTIEDQLRWEHSFYFAPAIKVRLFINLIKLLYPFKSSRLPSFGDKAYKAHKRLYASYYKGMTDLQKAYANQKPQTNITSFQSKKDEVISFRSTKKMLNEHKIYAIKSHKKSWKESYHLITNSEVLSSEDWTFVKRIIDQTL